MLGELDGGMLLGGGGAADEQGRVDARAFQFLGDGDHLVERGRDQAGQADEVGLQALGLGDDLLGGRHHAEVGDGVVVAGEHDADDVLADVVDVALDRRDEEGALGGAADLLGGHEWLEVGDRGLHDLGRLHHLGEEHLTLAEEFTDDAHTVHQRAFDDEQRLAQLEAGFLGVGDGMVVDALDQGVFEAGFDAELAPFVLLGGVGAFGLRRGETRRGFE